MYSGHTPATLVKRMNYRRFNIRMSHSLHGQFAKAASRRGQTIADWLRQAGIERMDGASAPNGVHAPVSGNDRIFQMKMPIYLLERLTNVAGEANESVSIYLKQAGVERLAREEVPAEEEQA